MSKNNGKLNGVELIVDPEFAAMMPPQTEEEIDKLEMSLLDNGCLDPLKYHAETGILIDGHTRKRLCDKHKVAYDLESVSIPGEGDEARAKALDWCREWQMGRRNLTDLQKSYIRGKDYLASKRSVGKPKSEKPADGDEFPLVGDEAESEEKAEKERLATRDVLARKYNVGPATISRDADLALAVDQMGKKERAEFLSGKTDKKPSEVIAEFAPKKPRAKKGAKNNKDKTAKFAWGEFQILCNRIAKATGGIAKHHDCDGCNEHRAALRVLGEFSAKVAEWRERLDKKAEKNKE